jgi:hypothetical protein
MPSLVSSETTVTYAAKGGEVSFSLFPFFAGILGYRSA